MSGAYSRQRLDKRYRHFNERLADEIRKSTEMMTVSDFGAGIGLYVAYLRAFSGFAIGYDGTADIASMTEGCVQTANLAEPCDLPMTQCVMSIEVGEHIPKEFEGVFVDNLCKHSTELIICSWAVKNQRGKNHINCKDPDEVVRMFHERGWFVNVAKTFNFREQVGKPFDRKILLFEKTVRGYYNHEKIEGIFKLG